MDNDIFLQKVISATKDDSLIWNKVLSSVENDLLNYEYSAYYSKNNNQIIAIQKYREKEAGPDDADYFSVHYMLSVCSNHLQRQYDMEEGDFNDASELIRLYRIVERKANKIDDILDTFTSNL